MANRSMPEMEALLAPITVASFFGDNWEKKHIVFRHDDASYFSNLLTLAEFDALVTSSGWGSPPLEVISGGRVLPSGEYCRRDGAVDENAVMRRLLDGASLRVTGLQNYHGATRDYCAALKRQTSISFRTNIYFTPGFEQGFNPHYDTHDVFVLQLHGEKEWSIYDGGPYLPTAQEPFQRDVTKPGAEIDRFVLKPGDALYVPRGVMHDARASSAAPSLHATIGAYPYRWEDLVREVISEARTTIPLLRQSLPIGVLASGPRPSLEDGYATVVGGLGDKGLAALAMSSIEDHLIRTGAQRFSGLVAEIEAVRGEELANRRVRVRPHAWFVTRDDPDAFHIDFKDRSISFPIHAAGTVRALLGGQECSADFMEGPLDLAGRTTVIRRLIKEGLLEILPA